MISALRATARHEPHRTLTIVGYLPPGPVGLNGWLAGFIQELHS